jgi:plastocyanin
VVSHFALLTSNPQPFAATIGPDGNLWFTEWVNAIARLVIGVAVRESGFVPGSYRVAQGGSVQWTFLGSGTQQVRDGSGMGLFDSGLQAPLATFSFSFSAAGSYPYVDPLHPSLTGRVKVPVLVSPPGGTIGTTFTITWASAPAEPGFVVDVQIRRPGDLAYSAWLSGQTAPSASFVPDAGPGTYRFRARLHKAGTGTHSDWSGGAAITVS